MPVAMGKTQRSIGQQQHYSNGVVQIPQMLPHLVKNFRFGGFGRFITSKRNHIEEIVSESVENWSGISKLRFL
jgi:hypothetical protein